MKIQGRISILIVLVSCFTVQVKSLYLPDKNTDDTQITILENSVGLGMTKPAMLPGIRGRPIKVMHHQPIKVHDREPPKFKNLGSENSLVEGLLDRYPNKNSRPAGVGAGITPLQMYMSYSLLNLVNFDEDNAIATIHGWIYAIWRDPSMVWNATALDIDRLNLDSQLLWMPPFKTLQAIEETIDENVKSLVFPNGMVMYTPQMTNKIQCVYEESMGDLNMDLDIDLDMDMDVDVDVDMDMDMGSNSLYGETDYTEYEVAMKGGYKCKLTLLVWTYNSQQVALTWKKDDNVLDHFTSHPKWTLSDVTSSVGQTVFDARKGETYDHVHVDFLIRAVDT